MNAADLIAARKKAEQAVEGMVEGPLKIKAFEVILASLLAGPTQLIRPVNADRKSKGERTVQSVPTSLAARIDILKEEDFFSEPRALADIQNKLKEHGWHYPQANLSTPLVRLVRQRQLRRLQTSGAGKKVWKYSLP